MPIKLANNVSARLTAPLQFNDDSIVISLADTERFPTLGVGDWHPLTLVDANGDFEIVTATSRDENIIYIDRAQEGTLKKVFGVGDRVELRITAGALEALQLEQEAYAEATADAAVNAAIAGAIQANIDTAKEDAIAEAATTLATAISGVIQTNINTASAAGAAALSSAVADLDADVSTTLAAGQAAADAAQAAAQSAASSALASALVDVDAANDATLAAALAAVAAAEAAASGALTAAIAGPIQSSIDAAEAGAIAAAATDATTKVSTENAAMQAAINALRIELNGNLSAALPPGFGPVPWSLATEPAGWIFADGRTLTGATPYTALRAAYIAASFPFGQDGSGNPKVPDMRGRTAAGLDNMGGGAAGRLTGATLGAGLGAQTHALTTAELASHSHGVTDPGHFHTASDSGHVHAASQDDHTHSYSPGALLGNAGGYGAYKGTTAAGGSIGYTDRVLVASSSSSPAASTTSGVSANAVYIGTGYAAITVASKVTGVTTQNAGSGTAHNNVQPTLVTNYIIKV
jgi:microcystin-dependent protein